MKGRKNEIKKEIKEALKEIGVDTDVNCTKIVQKEVKWRSKNGYDRSIGTEPENKDYEREKKIKREEAQNRR